MSDMYLTNTPKLDFDSTSSLKQQSAGRHVAPLINYPACELACFALTP